MKNIITKYYRYMNSINEGLTPEQIQIKVRDERNFINIMKQRCETLLSEDEKDMDHPIHEFLLGCIYNVYDNNRFDEKSITGLNEDDYKLAFSQIEEKLSDVRLKSGYRKELEAYTKRKAKAAAKREIMKAKGFTFDDEDDDEE